jgi:hypothetical protein
MKITLEIPENRYSFFKLLLRLLSFPKEVQENPEELTSKSEVLIGIRESFEEVKLYKRGEVQLKNAREAMQEIETELANE